MNLDYDVIIIGGGPAGLSAAIYAARANKKTVFIEKGAPGGKMVKTNIIENWTGDKKVSGPDLSLRMFDHAKSYADYKYGDVVDIKTFDPYHHEVILASGDKLSASSIIIATGMIEKVPPVENIEKFENRGVSYCAICDGPIFKDQEVAVIGGGNSAAEEAIYLSSIAKHVYIFVRKPEMRAEKKIVEDLTKNEKVTILYESTITSVLGENKVEGIETLVKGEKKTFENIKAIFPYIGQKPVTDFANNLGITDKNGFIETDELMETKVKGIFAIGDVRKKHIRQIATAVSDGVIAGKIINNR